ncbi:hypothetical protein DH2020_025305 [Rehmannia glutinosa]|uniref:Cellulose synthase-like protein n=1 Tax=Rehmannia glutinosa TaxID=99300 RepID=A0ABR0W2Q0_REHGL
MAGRSFRPSDSQLGRASGPPAVTFQRRTSSGRYVNLSRDSIDSDINSVEFSNIRVTRAHLMDKVIESETNHPQMAGAKGSSCAIQGCDGKVMSDERGEDILLANVISKYAAIVLLILHSGLMRSQTGVDFDHNRWLFETKGTYGYGNAIWPKDGGFTDDKNDESGEPPELLSKPWRPLTRKLKIRAAILSPYRVSNPNDDARWLWMMSIICELWFAFSWLLDQLPKLCPVNRATDLNVLKEKFETPSPANPTGKSDLPGIDIFVSTADPEKEPPLVTANTILSILAADYPVEKLSCYVSDDGGALLTFEAMAEAASFANLWDRRRVKREYDEFKVRINGLPDSIRRRSDAYNAREEIKALKLRRQNAEDETLEALKVSRATWMADGTHWPGTWTASASEHSKGDHAGIIQVMLKPPSDETLYGTADSSPLDFTEVDIRLPMLVYVSREKRPGYDHNKKAGAMNALVRASAIMSNGPFILNLDCDHYIYNSQAIREGMCFMMDRGGDRICYVQFPQRVRFMSALVASFADRTLWVRPAPRKTTPAVAAVVLLGRKKSASVSSAPEDHRALRMGDSDDDEMNPSLISKRFGNSSLLIDSIPVAEFQGRPLADHPAVKNGRPPGALTIPRELLDASTVAEAISVISCWLHQVLRWATGSVEIFFSRNNALLASSKMKILQRIAYLNVGIYPFTSLFLIVYCFLPALSLFSGQFIVQSLDVTFLTHLLGITLTLCALAVLEIKWSGINLEEWWRNEQFWLIGGTSAHLAAVLQGLLKVIAGIEISFTLTSKSAGDENDDEFADLYILRWSSLMIPPITIMITNLIAIAVGVSRTIYSAIPQWSRLLGGVFFSFWVLAHLYPFAKGLMGRRGRTPTIVFVWSGLIAITISLLWVAISPPAGSTEIGGSFQFP